MVAIGREERAFPAIGSFGISVAGFGWVKVSALLNNIGRVKRGIFEPEGTAGAHSGTRSYLRTIWALFGCDI
jgi:hypothetical protein